MPNSKEKFGAENSYFFPSMQIDKINNLSRSTTEIIAADRQAKKSQQIDKINFRTDRHKKINCRGRATRDLHDLQDKYRLNKKTHRIN
jgi:23S rRNA maturation mini-RNase III